MRTGDEDVDNEGQQAMRRDEYKGDKDDDKDNKNE